MRWLPAWLCIWLLLQQFRQFRKSAHSVYEWYEYVLDAEKDVSIITDYTRYVIISNIPIVIRPISNSPAVPVRVFGRIPCYFKA